MVRMLQPYLLRAVQPSASMIVHFSCNSPSIKSLLNAGRVLLMLILSLLSCLKAVKAAARDLHTHTQPEHRRPGLHSLT